jgi:hypothetical protein
MRLTPEQELIVRAKMWDKVLPPEIAQAFRDYADTIDALTAERDAARGEALRDAAEVCGASDGWDMHPKDYQRLILALDPSAVKAAEEHKR